MSSRLHPRYLFGCASCREDLQGRWPGSHYPSSRRYLRAPGPRCWDPGITDAGGVDERTGTSVSFFLFHAVQNDSISTVLRSPVA